MALEQLRAWRAGRALDELGATEQLEPDGFPLLKSSELRYEHQILAELVQISGGVYDASAVLQTSLLEKMVKANAETRTRYYLALLERTFAHDADLNHRGRPFGAFFDYGPAAITLTALHDSGVDHERIVGPTLEWFNCYRFNYYGTPPLRRVIAWIKMNYSGRVLPEGLRHLLIAVRGQFAGVDRYENTETFMALRIKGTEIGKQLLEDAPIERQIDAIIGDGPWSVLVPCEEWSKAALEQLSGTTADDRDVWFALLQHCHGATSARPSARWLKAGGAFVKTIGAKRFAERLIAWSSLVDRGRVSPTLCMSWENVDEQKRMHEVNATVLRGLLWLCPSAASADLIRAVTRVGSSAYRKIRGLGPRAVKVGNAAVYALSQIQDPDAVGQLALLKVKVKFGTAQKEIEKAFSAAAERAGLPRDEIEELSIPSYGLTEVGICEEPMGEFTARLTVTGTTSTELVWVKADGKIQRGVPASVKESHKEDLKDLQAAAKDIQKMLPAQRERIDGLFLHQKSWPLPVWRERYLNHPLIGTLARRILWEFKNTEKSVTAIWFNGRLVDLDLNPVALPDGQTIVQLWHPIEKSSEEVIAWRSWLDAQQIQQPFKQAHREIYVLTDAERNTRTYSNRYAAHVLKQHQFNALCALRGWKNQLRLMVDAEYSPPSLHLPQWGLRAEFWIEGIGQDYGSDTNDSGVYLRLSTDQVRFYRVDAAQRTAHAGGGGYHPGYRNTDAEPVPLEEIPALVFSEVMRDVDMFVGVASVGNDPAWSDGGPDGRYRDYWQNYSFGDLNASAKTRKQVLQRLVPKLKIASRCSFEEKFLLVKGSLRTYKIHLGSGNILMMPNDQYLCIVPKQGAPEDQGVLLPFEGDRTLSVIISKAFLLAEDAKIKDPSIVSQIKR